MKTEEFKVVQGPLELQGAQCVACLDQGGNVIDVWMIKDIDPLEFLPEYLSTRHGQILLNDPETKTSAEMLALRPAICYLL